MSSIQRPNRVGQRARVVAAGPILTEWDGAIVEVVGINDDGNYDYYYDFDHGPLLIVEDVDRPGHTAAMFASRMEVIEDAPVEDVYTVHDAEGLDALPGGTVLEDKDGDRYEKRESGRLYTTDRDHDPILAAINSQEFARDYAPYGPWQIVNPETLEPQAETSAPPAQWEQELLDIMPSVEEETVLEDVPFGTQDDVSVKQNDIEKQVDDDLIEAIMATLEPGDVVLVAENPRVFDDKGKSSYLNLVEGETVTVVNVPDDCRGYYLAGRTLEVRRANGTQQYADVTALLPYTLDQVARVDDYLESKKGEEDDAATEGDPLTELMTLLGLTDEENGDENTAQTFSAKGDLEALEATLPETPVARRAGLIGIAQGIVESMDYEATPITVLEYARFLAGDFNGEE